MKQRDRIVMEAMSHQFHKDLKELVDKYQIHAGYFVWVHDEPEPKHENKIEGVGAASVCRLGCPSCATIGLSVAVLGLDPEFRELFAQSLSEINSESIRSMDMPKADSPMN